MVIHDHSQVLGRALESGIAVPMTLIVTGGSLRIRHSYREHLSFRCIEFHAIVTEPCAHSTARSIRQIICGSAF